MSKKIERKTDNVIIPADKLEKVIQKMLDIRTKFPGERIMLTKFRETGQIVVWAENSKSSREEKK